MAQLVERFHGMEEVAGSNPAGSTKYPRGPKFTWLNTSFALKRQAVRVRPGPPMEFDFREANASYLSGPPKFL